MTAEYVVLRCELAGISIRNSTDAKMFPDMVSPQSHSL